LLIKTRFDVKVFKIIRNQGLGVNHEFPGTSPTYFYNHMTKQIFTFD